MIGLDTTAIIDLFKGNEAISKIVNNSNELFFTTIINYQEIMFGINPQMNASQEEMLFYDQFFDHIYVITLNKENTKSAADLFWNLKKKGKEIGKSDCMIASILQSNGVQKIITKNVRHFKEIPQLEVISY